MKRNNLTTAVLAGIAGIAGIAGSAQAVNVNPDGLGQVLIYPFYTTNNGNQTLLSVVNTTDQAKAVKVRFLESLNSREVLDFNLYLSKYDVWTAAIFDNAGTPTMITGDSSCTVPYFYGMGGGLGVQPFLNFAYLDDADPARDSISRATEGHFEIIEMGEMHDLDFGSATAVTHVQPGDGPNTQEPADCQQLVDAWTINHAADYWLEDTSYDITAATGGLFGGAAIVNAGAGTMYSYDAKAINGFWSDGSGLYPNVPAGVRHTNPGTEVPSLISGINAEALIFSDSGGLVTLNYANSSIEAVSAMFMHDTIMNEYAIMDILAAQSEWVLTFPTKRFYIDPAYATWWLPNVAPLAPFTQALQTDATSCEDFSIDFWDREEGTPTEAPPGTTPPTVSPQPPPGPDPDLIVFELCAETNVIRFDDQDEIPALPIVGTNGFDSLVTFGLPDGFDAGWAKIDMVSNVDEAGDVGDDRTDSLGLLGLPVVGFWFEAFTNGTLEGGTVLANYGGIFEHKGTRAQDIIIQ